MSQRWTEIAIEVKFALDRSASYATNQVRQRKRTDKDFELKRQAISKILLEASLF